MYRMMLEPNTLNKLHCAMVGTGQEVVKHASDELLPRGRREVQNNLPGDILVIKITLHETKLIKLLVAIQKYLEEMCRI